MKQEPDSAAHGVIESLRLAGLAPISSTPERWHRDYSIFRLAPSAVVRPTSESDVVRAVGIAHDHRVPLVARGGGSNTGGAALTNGILLVMDGQSMTDLIANALEGTVTAQPGATHDRVQALLREQGRWLPSDPSSGPLSCIGGNIATRASGPHALRHGAIHRYIREVRIVLSDGTVVDTRDPASIPSRLASGIKSIADDIAADSELCAELEARRDSKWATGYELLALLDHRGDPVRALPRLIAGSMGTLGILTEAVLESRPVPGAVAASLLRFPTATEACEAAVALRGCAAAIEIVSSSALEILAGQTDVLGGSDDGALIIVEWSGEEARSAVDQLEALADTGKWKIPAEGITVAHDPVEIEGMWRARKALLPVIRRLAGDGRAAYSVVNDVGVQPSNLGGLIGALEAIFDRRELIAPIYGHAGNGNLHLRPLFPVGDVRLAWEVANEVYEAVGDRGGCISPEHGLGRLRAPFLGREWSDAALGAMRRLKHLFDPDDILNPGVIFHELEAHSKGVAAHGWAIEPVLE